LVNIKKRKRKENEKSLSIFVLVAIVFIAATIAGCRSINIYIGTPRTAPKVCETKQSSIEGECTKDGGSAPVICTDFTFERYSYEWMRCGIKEVTCKVDGKDYKYKGALLADVGKIRLEKLSEEAPAVVCDLK
jgi:hypothetical protein